MAEDADEGRSYGTIEGVFVPTLLTILGVILYLRTGWVVGNAGLLGALGIILLTFVIVGCTALSLASVSTNVAPPAGGAYGLVARSFGVEAGGAVGLPLYLSQTLVIVLYTFGFRDGWLQVFPEHPHLLVDLGMVTFLVVVALISTKTAFRVQYVILAVVAASLVSIGVAVVQQPAAGEVVLFGAFPGAPEDGFPGTDLWTVFAVFFPAATGIMAGLNMSGELSDPRRSIMRGTLAAVACGAVVYVGAALAIARLADTDELVGSYTALIDQAAWPAVVLAGLLAATFSSALASLVGAPRILQALADHAVVPASGWLRHRDKRGEPRHALLVTIVIILVTTLTLRELNAVAPLITLVFLLTYAAINLAVLAESLIGLPSYRPTFRVPWIAPAVGAVGCLLAMAVINAAFMVLALVFVVGVLVWLAKRHLDHPHSDIRRAALLALASWATRRARAIPGSEERVWVPRLLVPVDGSDDLLALAAWAGRLVPPAGAVRFAFLDDPDGADPLERQVSELAERLSRDGLDASSVVVVVDDDEPGVLAALQTEVNRDNASDPNVLMCRLLDDPANDGMLENVLAEAQERGVGVVLLPGGEPPALERPPARVALWVRGPYRDPVAGGNLPQSDLALLVAYHLTRDDGCELNLITAVDRAEDAERTRRYLEDVAELARLPKTTAVRVLTEPFPGALGTVDDTALNVLAIPPDADAAELRNLVATSAAPCLLVRDSGVESAFA